MISSVLGLSLLVLLGAGIIIVALFATRVIAWENRWLISFADALQSYRLSIEEEERLLAEPELSLPVLAADAPARFVMQSQQDRAA